MVKARRITGLLLVWTAPDETLNQTVSLPRCSLRGRSGARHARGAARGSAPPIPTLRAAATGPQVGTGKQAQAIELESRVRRGAAWPRP